MTQEEQLLVISQSASYFSLQSDVYSSFLTNSIFKTPIEKTSLNALLGLSAKFKDLITQYYNTTEVDQQVNLFSQSNTILVEYVYYLINKYPQEAKNKMSMLSDNCKKAARLFSKISPYWRDPEWNSLMVTYLDLIERYAALLLGDVGTKEFEEKISVLYECFSRITQDISAYFSGGIISDKVNVNKL